MKTINQVSKLLGIFALVLLSIGFASAQTGQDACLTITPVSFPSSATSAQNTFQATFNIAFGSTLCNPRTINSVSLSSMLSGTTNSIGAWSVANNFPITLNSTSNNPTLLTTTYTIPSSGTGTLLTTTIISANSTSSSGQNINYTYTFTLPSVTLNPQNQGLRFNNIPTTPISPNSNITITLTNTGTTALSNILLSETTNKGVTFNPNSLASLTQGITSSPISLILTALRNINFGLNDITIKAESGQAVAASTFQVKKTFCSRGETPNTNLTITDVNWENNGEGDDNDWELLDEIEVEVEVENNNQDEDIDTVIVLGFFDSTGKDIADDLDFLPDSDSDEEEIEINIDEDDKESVTFRFKVPADFDRGNYKMAVKVYNDDEGESVECDDSASELNKEFYQEISIDRTDEDGRLVVVDDIEMNDQAACSETVTGSFTVFNVGDKDQDRVLITMKNSELDLDQEFEITSDLDQGDDQTFSFEFEIPNGVENKLYPIVFQTMYEYDDGVYEEESEDEFIKLLNVVGCSGRPSPVTGAIISASLDSDEAKAGEEFEVKVTIKNTGDDSIVFSIGVRDFSSWGELVSISPTSISVEPSETEDVTVVFKANADSEGAQSFKVSATSDGKVTEQDVEVNIEGAGRSPFSLSFENNSLIWIIGIINVILIVLIILVAVKLSRR